MDVTSDRHFTTDALSPPGLFHIPNIGPQNRHTLTLDAISALQQAKELDSCRCPLGCLEDVDDAGACLGDPRAL